jgi:hypothetical protein
MKFILSILLVLIIIYWYTFLFIGIMVLGAILAVHWLCLNFTRILSSFNTFIER